MKCPKITCFFLFIKKRKFVKNTNHFHDVLRCLFKQILFKSYLVRIFSASLISQMQCFVTDAIMCSNLRLDVIKFCACLEIQHLLLTEEYFDIFTYYTTWTFFFWATVFKVKVPENQVCLASSIIYSRQLAKKRHSCLNSGGAQIYFFAYMEKRI
jgi:hypothetical protein